MKKIIILCLSAFLLGCASNNTNVDRAESIESTNSIIEEEVGNMRIQVTINDQVLYAQLEDNSSASAFYEKLEEGPVTVHMDDFAGFEKVGSLGFSLVRNDHSYTTKPGDIILFQGSEITFYYGENNWNFTKLGEFENATRKSLLDVFGNGSITAKIAIAE